MMTKVRPLPPLELVEQLLDYEPETGALKWKVRRSNCRPETLAGCVGKDGYVHIKIENVKWRAHRIAWLLLTKADPGSLHIDHINGNKSDNRAANLRLATIAENMHNRKVNINNTSGFKGVSYHPKTGKWQASIRLQRRLRYIGLFCTPELAHMAYCKAAAELHGEFARTA